MLLAGTEEANNGQSSPNMQEALSSMARALYTKCGSEHMQCQRWVVEAGGSEAHGHSLATWYILGQHGLHGTLF